MANGEPTYVALGLETTDVSNCLCDLCFLKKKIMQGFHQVSLLAYMLVVCEDIMVFTLTISSIIMITVKLTYLLTNTKATVCTRKLLFMNNVPLLT